MIRLALSLPCPINRRFVPILVMKGGRKIAIQSLSKEYRQKQQTLVDEVWRQLGGKPQPMTRAVQISYTMTPRSKITADCDAYEKALLDGLQKAGVYLDDKQVVQVSKERLPLAVFPGSLAVTITELPENA